TLGHLLVCPLFTGSSTSDRGQKCSMTHCWRTGVGKNHIHNIGGEKRTEHCVGIGGESSLHEPGEHSAPSSSNRFHLNPVRFIRVNCNNRMLERDKPNLFMRWLQS